MVRRAAFPPCSPARAPRGPSRGARRHRGSRSRDSPGAGPPLAEPAPAALAGCPPAFSRPSGARWCSAPCWRRRGAGGGARPPVGADGGGRDRAGAGRDPAGLGGGGWSRRRRPDRWSWRRWSRSGSASGCWWPAGTCGSPRGRPIGVHGRDPLVAPPGWCPGARPRDRAPRRWSSSASSWPPAGHLLERARAAPECPARGRDPLLLPAWWLMATIAGPVGLGVAALPAVPFSPAAERLLAIPSLIAAWAVAGLWPLHRQAARSAGGAGRGVPAGPGRAPGGARGARALAAARDAARGRRDLARGAERPAPLGSRSAWRGSDCSAPARLGLVGRGDSARRRARGGDGGADQRASRGTVRARRAGDPAGGVRVGRPLAVGAGLQGEVVYTALAVAGLVALCGRPWPQAMTASAASARSPRA